MSDTPPAGSPSFSQAAESPQAKAASIENQAERARNDANATPLPPPPIKPFSLDFSPPEFEQNSKGTASSTTSSNTSVPPLSDPSKQSINSSGLNEAATENASTSQTQRTGARSSKGSLSSIERKRRNAVRAFFLLGAMSVGATVVYMGRPWENEDLKSRAGVDKVRMRT